MTVPPIKKRRLSSPSGQDHIITSQAKSNVTASWDSAVGDSNMFKLKTQQLLERVQPDYERRMVTAEHSLRKLKDTIERIPDRGEKPVLEAEHEQLETHNVRVPFSQPRPAQNAKYTLAYFKPANIRVVGSYARKTAIQVAGRLTIDLAVTMPSHIFQEKDYLNYRYFHKRAYYLACIASGIKKFHEKEFALDFAHQNQSHLQPILNVIPLQDGAPKSKYQIRVILAADGNLFPISKTLPNKNCIRSKASEVPSVGSSTNMPTPFYNSLLRSECSSLAYLKELHASSLQSDGFSNACQLGSVWLRQRGLGPDFGPFEWACTIALLMQGGGPRGRPILSHGYDGFQLFKAMLQYLSLRNLVTNPVFVHSDEIALVNLERPVLFDGKRGMNILFKMTPWSYAALTHEASVTLKLLNDSCSDQFDACFVTKVDDLMQRFDYVIEMCMSQVPKPILQMADALNDETFFFQRVYDVLTKGLGDRITLLHVAPSPILPWDGEVPAPQIPLKALRQVQVGILINPQNISRTVDRGPYAEDRVAAAQFRLFWGDKAELRRFKDGSIRESLIWSNSHPIDNALKQIAAYVVRRHLGKDVVDTMKFIGESFERLLPDQKVATIDPSTSFQSMMSASQRLEKDVRALEGLPLQIRQITAADAQLRYSSKIVPTLHPGPMEPANICVQFEGSARWPDDIIAVQRTKIAFLLKMGELLQESTDGLTARLGLEHCDQRLLNIAFLDIQYPSSVPFRIRIHHERELNLLERLLKYTAHIPIGREETASALSTYKRGFIQGVIHTQAVCKLSTRFPLLSPCIRLMKKWRDSHMLSNHVGDELIELLVIRTFVHPYPWSVPGSVMTGFLRTLTYISKWDWQSEPLIVDFSGEMARPEVEAVRLRFEAWRKIDPALNRVSIFAASNLDPTGTTWTDICPSKVVAARFTSLAKAACGMLKDQGTGLEPELLFVASLADYDFLIHLNPRLTKDNGREKRHSAFKNLDVPPDQDRLCSDFNPVQSFLGELKAIYGSNILFFSSKHECSLIAGLWNPQIEPRPWKVNLPYSTRFVVRSGHDEPQIGINKAASLHDIARLGGDLVSRIELKRLGNAGRSVE